MSATDKLVDSIIDAVDKRQDKKTSSYDTTATVVRVEGKTAYVHIDGGVDETPASMNITCHKGDTVQVRVGGGRAWITGNGTNPPTDDSTANTAVRTATGAYTAAKQAWEQADIAHEAAESAKISAQEAKVSAQDAKNSADEADIQAKSATTSANGALIQLATVENVIDTLNYLSDKNHFVLTEDTSVQSGKDYYIRHKNFVTINIGTQTVAGVTFTVNAAEGTITVNGTATADIYRRISPAVGFYGIDLTLTGCPEGGSEQTYYLRYDYTAIDTGEGVTYTSTGGTEPPLMGYIIIKEGTTVDNLVFKPMVRFAADKYDEFIVGASEDQYCIVDNPTGNPSSLGYYEVDMETAIRTYLALTNDGLYVLKDDNAWKVLISNTGVQIQNESGVPVAKYSDSVQIGKDLFSHLNLSYNSLRLKDFNSNDYLVVSDLRGESGSFSETFNTGSGTPPAGVQKVFYVKHTVRSTNSVKADGVDTSYTVSYNTTLNKYEYYLPNVTANQEIVIDYNTNDDTTKTYTLGLRETGTQGEMSFVSGYKNVAAGDYSEVSGYMNTATQRCTHIEGTLNNEVQYSGYNNHIEGVDNNINGARNSHIEGEGCEIMYNPDGIANAVHVQNFHTKALFDYQTAIGKYNDNKGADLFEIGNGTSDSARSNAFEVTEGGVIRIALNTSASSGVDHDLYAAITALGWQSAVID